ncbi:MAG: alpha-L-fucosidase [candidate division Zixibacteria bacterium]|nr:alpha-L-fucosidase [candidate division Zixibacteria bacterium]
MTFMRPVEDTSSALLKAHLLAVKRFRDLRFGLFVNWGVYSIPGRGEWVMHQEQIPTAEYAKLPPQFAPSRFDAEAYADLMEAAGQKYMVFDAKHHDGFCLFDTALTDWKVTRTPFGRDPVAELAQALCKRSLILGFYYSLLDWTHPAYRNDWPAYVAYYQGQIRELCTKYGEIGMIWLDGYWPAHPLPAPHFGEGGSWQLAETYDMIHTLQPNALIGNNHHVGPLKGEDFQMFEQDLPGENTAGFNAESVGALPLESCLTVNGNWGYHAGDHNHKSPRELIRFLVQCIGRDSNLLLNVGPTPDGDVQPEHVERLRAVGDWLRINGEAVYENRPGPVPPQPWGYVTHRPDDGRLFLHILDWPSASLTVPVPGDCSARLLCDATRIATVSREGAVTLSLPRTPPDKADTVVELTLTP